MIDKRRWLRRKARFPDRVTLEAVHHRRRDFLKDSLAFAATSLAIGGGLLGLVKGRRRDSRAPIPADVDRLEASQPLRHDRATDALPRCDDLVS